MSRTGAGCEVVGHTEASVINAQFRLSKLRLSDLISCLYAGQNRGLGHPRPETARPINVGRVKSPTLAQRKPDERVLLGICADAGIEPGRTLHVGDSVSRDIGMAKAAGVWSAWAQYGHDHDPRMWPRLVRITHWSEQDVRHAKEAETRYGPHNPTRPSKKASKESSTTSTSFTPKPAVRNRFPCPRECPIARILADFSGAGPRISDRIDRIHRIF